MKANVEQGGNLKAVQNTINYKSEVCTKIG